MPLPILIALMLKAAAAVLIGAGVTAIILTWADIAKAIRERILHLTGQVETVELDARDLIRKIKQGQVGRVDIGLRDKGGWFRRAKLIDQFPMTCNNLDESILNRMDAHGVARVRAKEILRGY